MKKDTEYNIALDIRSNRPNAEPKIFVKGYTLHKKRMRVIYKTYLNCRLKGTGWQHFQQSFHPTKNTPKVTEMRVMIFCYWPPGEYFVDNVSITENPATPTPTPTPEPTGTQKRSP